MNAYEARISADVLCSDELDASFAVSHSSLPALHTACTLITTLHCAALHNLIFLQMEVIYFNFIHDQFFFLRVLFSYSVSVFIDMYVCVWTSISM